MIQYILQKRTAHSWCVCQKCKSTGAAEKPLVIVPKQLIILCEDCFLQYRKIFSIEDREFVRDGDERYRYD
jgi:hypothetical protein